MSFFLCMCQPGSLHSCVAHSDENDSVTTNARYYVEWTLWEQGLPTGRLSPRTILHEHSLQDILADMNHILHVAQQEDLHPLIEYFANVRKNKGRKTKGSASRARNHAGRVYDIVKGCEKKDACVEAVQARYPVLPITSALTTLIHNTWECTHVESYLSNFDDTWEGLFKNLEHILNAFVNTHDGVWFFYKGHYDEPNRPY